MARNRLPFGDQISDVDWTRDQASQHAEAEIGLVARLDNAHRHRAVRMRPVAGRSTARAAQAPAPSPPACIRPSPMPKRRCRRRQEAAFFMTDPPSYVTGWPELSSLPPSITTRSPGSRPFLDQHRSGFVTADRHRLQRRRLGRRDRRSRPRALIPPPSARSTAT